jgi:hypothetical protein
MPRGWCGGLKQAGLEPGRAWEWKEGAEWWVPAVTLRPTLPPHKHPRWRALRSGAALQIFSVRDCCNTFASAVCAIRHSPLRRWIAPAGQQHFEYLSSQSPKFKCPSVRHRVSRRTRDSVSTARPAVYSTKRQHQHSRALREHCTPHVLGTAPRMAHRPSNGELTGRPSTREAREAAGRHTTHLQRDHGGPIHAHRPSSNAVQERGRTTPKTRPRRRSKSRNQGGETEQSPPASGSSPNRKSPG